MVDTDLQLIVCWYVEPSFIKIGQRLDNCRCEMVGQKLPSAAPGYCKATGRSELDPEKLERKVVQCLRSSPIGNDHVTIYKVSFVFTSHNSRTQLENSGKIFFRCPIG